MKRPSPVAFVQEQSRRVNSNSLLHHLVDPMVLWRTIRLLAAKRAAIFVMDLARPASRAEAQLEYLQTQLVSDRHIIVFGRFYREI